MTDYQNISPMQLQQMLLEGQVCLVDVRTEAEAQQLHIANGVLMPLQLLPMRLDELEKQQPIVFYCRIGARSAQAAAFAVQQGYTEVYNLAGGIVDWVQRGLPVVQHGS